MLFIFLPKQTSAKIFIQTDSLSNNVNLSNKYGHSPYPNDLDLKKKASLCLTMLMFEYLVMKFQTQLWWNNDYIFSKRGWNMNDIIMHDLESSSRSSSKTSRSIPGALPDVLLCLASILELIIIVVVVVVCLFTDRPAPGSVWLPS